ncbi:MAG: thiopurine S-methyltransferase [Gammaproteobacteria bacterium]|nr:thiopurine S-methyltransferase [Gammaproteobacteria bacterium]NNM14500.1 thiopurine S-methyltransferase [Gammaproteobacteria bacterium]
MQASFWLNKWQQHEIGFHQDDYHPALVKHFPKLESGAKILVPLCGKSKDMLWLEAQGYQVVGIELAESAVCDFFSEHGLNFTRTEQGETIHYQCTEKNILLIVGDFLALDESILSANSFDALYDRAALVALPAEMRTAYAQQCHALLKHEAKIMLINFNYDQSAMQGPPFSIDRAEIEALWHGRLSLIESFSMLRERSKFMDKGLVYMNEETWLT